MLSCAVEAGVRFACAETSGRLPDVTDLWNGDDPFGPYLSTALRARTLYVRDVHYMVRDEDVHIIDSSTGREQPHTRWEAGLHEVNFSFAGKLKCPFMEQLSAPTVRDVRLQHHA